MTFLNKVGLGIILLGFNFACSGPIQDNDKDLLDTNSSVISPQIESDSGYVTPITVKGQIPSVNVYVENSGSMYGYVGSGTNSDFRNMVFNFLTDIKISKIFDSMNLFFINSKPIFVGTAVDDFVKKLEPNTFKVSGGNSGSTDIVEIIKRVYPNNNTSILISDCIFSPGKGHNASEYLVNQQTGIKGFLGQRKNLSKTGIIIYRMLGNFKGYYYDTVDNKKTYVGIRPYYVWVIGDVESLKMIRNCIESKMKSLPDKMCIISNGLANIDYYIVPSGGKYRISLNDKYAIEKVGKVKTQKGKKMIVKIEVDYSKLLQDEKYLLDISNYETSDQLYVVDNIIKVDNEHFVITISSPVVKIGQLEVYLKNRVPQWVENCSDSDGGFPNPQGKLQKTYGLSYLIGGVYDAYTFKNDNLAVMKITIKK